MLAPQLTRLKEIRHTVAFLFIWMRRTGIFGHEQYVCIHLSMIMTIIIVQ